MGYELRALITREGGAKSLGCPSVSRPQGFALVPFADGVGVDGPAGRQLLLEAFTHLTGAVRDLAVRLSRMASCTYVEVDFFGGSGSQASIVFADGVMDLVPRTYEFLGNSPEPPRSEWPVNAALAAIGVIKGAAADEFDALALDARLDGGP